MPPIAVRPVLAAPPAVTMPVTVVTAPVRPSMPTAAMPPRSLAEVPGISDMHALRTETGTNRPRKTRLADNASGDASAVRAAQAMKDRLDSVRRPARPSHGLRPALAARYAKGPLGQQTIRTASLRQQIRTIQRPTDRRPARRNTLYRPTCRVGPHLTPADFRRPHYPIGTARPQSLPRDAATALPDGPPCTRPRYLLRYAAAPRCGVPGSAQHVGPAWPADKVGLALPHPLFANAVRPADRERTGTSRTGPAECIDITRCVRAPPGGPVGRPAWHTGAAADAGIA